MLTKHRDKSIAENEYTASYLNRIRGFKPRIKLMFLNQDMLTAFIEDIFGVCDTVELYRLELEKLRRMD